MDEMRIQVVDMHTGGEPVRIVMSGVPLPKGPSILDKRRDMRERQDHYRRFLMYEPRGHADMYGALLVEPSLPGADLAVLFMHNEGYSTMCGHAVISLGRFAVEKGLVAPQEPLTRVGIECPCGLVEAWVEVKDGRAGAVYFDSVPSFAPELQVPIKVPDVGTVVVDLAYGGAFYALAPAASLGLDLEKSRVRDLVDGATALSEAVRKQLSIRHPEAEDLSFLYGSILTDGRDAFEEAPTKNVCIFAESEVDRSPTGSGVTARLAAQHARGLIRPGQVRRFESLTGAVFTGSVKEVLSDFGGYPGIVARVGGKGHFAGEATFWLNDDDEIGRGFLLR